MKKIIIILIILSMSVLCLAQSVVAAAPVEVKIQHCLNETTHWGIATKYMAKRLEELSGGQMTGKIFHNGVLCNRDWKVGLEQTQKNIVQVFIESTIPFSTLKPELFTICTPFLFSDIDHLYRWVVSNPPVLDKWCQLLEESDLVVISKCVRPARQLSNSVKPIEKPEDMVGLKWRVPGMDLFVRTFELLDAKPVPLDSGQIYTAIQMGTIVGEDNAHSQLYSTKTYELTKYVNDWSYIFDIALVVVNKQFYEGLSDDQKTWLKTAADEARDIDYEAIKQEELYAYQKMEEAGVIFTHYTEEMKKPFKEKLLPINDVMRDVVGQEDWDKFIESVEAVR